MYRIMNEYMKGISLSNIDEIREKMEGFLSKQSLIIKSYCITENFNQYIVDIHLKDFNIEDADDLFKKLVLHSAYDYSTMTVRYNEGEAARYRYASCKEDRKGFYCDVVIRR